MTLVLGIDTGGTFTDGVILNPATREILAEAKSETTHFHLIDGIAAVLDKFEEALLRDIAYVALSTTLATNAIVEGKGCRVGLLMMGFDDDSDLPQCEIRKLPGSVDLHGKIKEPFDAEKTAAAIESLQGKVDAMVVSSVLSIRNPEIEESAKQAVRKISGLPCVAAHEIASTLGMKERTTTAILNGRLLSVIDSLIDAVKTVLAQKGLSVPIMIVKGDGSLMTESVARYRPIETILSGPAASIIGATYLQNISDALILDMGGTTTDIAILKNGRPGLTAEGASVGGWQTRVTAAEVTTCGLGGDSRIYRDSLAHEVKVGPNRVYSVSVITKDYPHYLAELKTLVGKKVGLLQYELCEGLLFLQKPPMDMELTTMERLLLRELQDGPHTLDFVADVLGTEPDFLPLGNLTKYGIIAMIGFTPTDLLHVQGKYLHGNAEGAEIALQLLAMRWDWTTEEAVACITQKISRNLSAAIFNSMLRHEGFPDDAEATEEFRLLSEKAFYGEGEGLFSLPIRLHLPVVGIGAPIRAWLDEPVSRFHTDVIYPEHHQVANAVGAAAGRVSHLYHVSVQNHEIDGVYVYAPWGRKIFGNKDDVEHSSEDVTGQMMHISNTRKSKKDLIEQAVEYSFTEGKRRIAEEMARDGITDYEILTERKDRTVKYAYNENAEMFIEADLEIIAVTVPQWETERKV